MSQVEITSPAPALVEITGSNGQTVGVPAAVPAMVEVTVPGPQGPPGGAPTRYDQAAAGTWIISHGLGRVPTVQVFLSSGEQVLADVAIDSIHITVVFASPTAGFVLAT